MSLVKEFTKGIFKENPVFVMLLGMCPLLAVTSSVQNAIGMGAASTFVLLCSNIVISLVRKLVPKSVRIPCFIVVIASFVTITQLIIKAYSPALDKSLGIFIPLIVVNCLILGRAESFASKKSLIPSIVDALGMGLGFTLAMFSLAFFREILGAGSFYGFSLFGESFQPALIMILPPGAFITLGLILAALRRWQGNN